MFFMTIRDNALWAKHIEGDPRVVRAHSDAAARTPPVALFIDGTTGSIR